MKTIMAALTAAVLFAGASAPASAEMDVEQIAEQLAKAAGSETVKFVNERRDVLRQIENDTDKPSFGSSEWWRQVERDQRGRRR